MENDSLHTVQMEVLFAHQLAIHPTAQRQLNSSYLKRLNKTFNLDAVGTVHAVRYPIEAVARTWVVDGQHRIRTMMSKGLGDYPVDVAIHIGVTNDAQASRLFLELNTRLTVRPLDKFLNEIRAGDPDALAIVDIVGAVDLVLGDHSENGHLNCVASLKKAYNLDDGAALRLALGILTEAYGKTSTLEGKLIEGVTMVMHINNGNVDLPTMARKLAKYGGGEYGVIGDARGRMKYNKGSVAKAIAALVVDIYNSGRRTNKLHL